jgi:hypothetical protein
MQQEKDDKTTTEQATGKRKLPGLDRSHMGRRDNTEEAGSATGVD